MKTAVRELCWRRRTKPSPFIAEIIEQAIDFPERFEDVDVPAAGLDNISVWISTERWAKGVETATALGTTLSAIVRVAVARELEEEGIQWDASTPRPRNVRIPSRE
jgi:hypothetical protein